MPLKTAVFVILFALILSVAALLTDVVDGPPTTHTGCYTTESQPTPGPSTDGGTDWG